MKTSTYKGKEVRIGLTGQRGRYRCEVVMKSRICVGHTTDSEVYDYFLDDSDDGRWARRACYRAALAGE